MALTIATGFVVDDAIVMVENVARLIEEGKKPFEAALLGAKQIGFTIVSLTLSLVAVLIPLLFMEGMVGRLFREFAVTLAASIILSALVSLTLTAMMSAYLLKPEPPEASRTWLVRLFEHAMTWSTKVYAYALDLALTYSGTTLLITALTIALTVILAITAPKSFFGHLGAAGGLVALAASLGGAARGVVPPTLNHASTDPDCPIRVLREPIAADGGAILKVSVARTGQAAAAVLVPGG
jgi:multidrug efflux pump